MGIEHIHRPPLYRFLRLIQNEPLPKKILDCGAGGKVPPLALFHSYGYETHGIEFSQDQIDRADRYCKEHDISLNIEHGDMRALPFENESFSYVYSISTIFHLTKKDSAIAVKEMERVLKPGGYLYVDFLSVEDGQYGEGKPVDPLNSPGEFYQKEHSGQVIHSYFEDNEPDKFFQTTKIVIKHKHLMKVNHKDMVYNPGFIGYFVHKPLKEE